MDYSELHNISSNLSNLVSNSVVMNATKDIKRQLDVEIADEGHSHLKMGENGITLIPQPSDDPLDPLVRPF